MNNLLDRGLIVSKGRLDVPGRPMLYGTTSDFLRSFGLTDLSGLPKTSDELIQAFEGAKADEEEKIAKKLEEENGISPDQLSGAISDAMPENSEDTTEKTEVPEEDYIDEPSAEDDIAD